MDKINQINQNLTTLTTDYLRTIAGLEATLSIIMDDEDINKTEEVINNLENMSLSEILVKLDDTPYEIFHIIMAMWNIFQTIDNSELMKETRQMLYDLCLDIDEYYNIVWNERQFILEETEIPLIELDEDDEGEELLEEVVE